MMKKFLMHLQRNRFEGAYLVRVKFYCACSKVSLRFWIFKNACATTAKPP